VQIGIKLSELRTEKNLSQAELAELLYVSHQAVSKWERGLALPTIDNIIFLMQYYEVSLEEILCLGPTKKVTVETIFDGHDRHYMIKEVLQGNIEGIHVSDILYLCSNEERQFIIKDLIDRHQTIDHRLWPRLSPTERYQFIKAEKEGKITMNVHQMASYMSPNENRKLKEKKR